MRRKLGTALWSLTVLVTLLAIVSMPLAFAETEFDKWLRGAAYDKEKLLEEFGEDSEQQFQSAEDLVLNFDASSVAMILPLDAQGLAAEAAQAFLEGFIHAAEADGARFALETYRTDGQSRSGLEAYRQAVNNGAGLVVGPLLRSSVNEVARLPVGTTVPTIMLHEPEQATYAGQLGSSQLYAFPLGGEVEIIQFAKLADRAVAPLVYVIVESSELGRRLENTFQKAWKLAGRSGAIVRTVTGQQSWKSIHDEVRHRLEQPIESDGLALTQSYLKHDYHAVFAAGSADFASQVRANMPSVVPVYVLASVQSGLASSGRNILVLTGIRFFEMPYVLNLRDGTQGLIAADYAKSLPDILQRYVAAGIDAYTLAASYGIWGLTGSWAHEGVTGMVSLQSGRFLRRGRLLELSGGVYHDITATPETDGG